MSDHNTYLTCKRETRYILWWLCHTSNAILQSIPKKNQNNEFENFVNTTGQVTTPNANEIAASTQRLGHSEYGPTGLGQLRLAELDLINDICYQAPLSAIDYTWLTMKFMRIFDAVEERLIGLRNPLYLQCILFDKNARMAQLQILIRREMPGHKECLEVLAKEMKKQSMGVEQSMAVLVQTRAAINNPPSDYSYPDEDTHLIIVVLRVLMENEVVPTLLNIKRWRRQAQSNHAVICEEGGYVQLTSALRSTMIEEMEPGGVEEIDDMEARLMDHQALVKKIVECKRWRMIMDGKVRDLLP
ncbi:hypothetical protein KCU78_g4244, partial [Aureobasidium melanogenum]